jgi:putative nucleotidyltransferase with HDIG domain
MATLQNGTDMQSSLNALIAEVTDLPPMPTTVMRALELAMDPDASIYRLQLLISKDEALSAKILRIVNSAMYALQSEVSTVSHALTVLGLDAVKSVLMAASVESVFQNAKDLGTKLMSDHSWGTALAARAIARRVGSQDMEEALVCGLMHDIGKPVMLQNLRARYTEIISSVYGGYSGFNDLELSSFGFSHSHVGAMLAQKWHFPPQLAEAVGFHHDPLSAPTYKQLACIINLADSFMISMGIGFIKNEKLILEKEESAGFLKLDEPTLIELALEIETAIQATSNLNR